jgi:hypothetical protein
MERRQVIAAAGATAATGLAGCLGGGGNSDTSSPEAAARAYFEGRTDNDSGRVSDVLHPRLNASVDEIEFNESQANVTSVESLETEVVREDIAPDDIESGFLTTIGDYVFLLRAADLKSLAEDAEMAIVETRVEGQEEPGAVLTGTANGDWYVVGPGLKSGGGANTSQSETGADSSE